MTSWLLVGAILAFGGAAVFWILARKFLIMDDTEQGTPSTEPSELSRLIGEARAIFDDLRAEAVFNAHGGGKRRAGERRWAEWQRRARLARDKLDRAIALVEKEEAR